VPLSAASRVRFEVAGDDCHSSHSKPTYCAPSKHLHSNPQRGPAGGSTDSFVLTSLAGGFLGVDAPVLSGRCEKSLVIRGDTRHENFGGTTPGSPGARLTLFSLLFPCISERMRMFVVSVVIR